MKMKKLLAAALAATMMISSMVTSMVASAETKNTVVTINPIEIGAAEYTADIDINFDAAVTAPHLMLEIAADGAIKTITSDATESIDVNTENGKILVETNVKEATDVTALNLDATFTLTDPAVAGQTITVTVTITEAVDYNEKDIAVTGGTGTYTLEAAVPDCDHANATLEYAVVDGNCVTTKVCPDCDAEPEVIYSAASLLYNRQLSLEADLTIKFKHKKSTGWSNYSDVYMTFDKEIYDTVGNVIDTKTTTVTSADEDLYVVETDGTLVVSFKGIAAKEMGNGITAKTYGTDAEGNVLLLGVNNYSVKEYAYNQFGKTGAVYEKLWPLLVDLLNYGSVAQTHFNYNKNNLVNAELTDELKALATPVRAYETVKAFENVNEPNVDLFSRALSLDNAVTIKYRVKKTNLAKYVTNDDYSNIKIVIEYKTTSNETKYETCKVSDGTLTLNESNQFEAPISKIAAANMSKPAIARLYNGETYLGSTTYSIESYANSKASDTTTLGSIVKAMMAYGDAAAKYLG